MMSVAAEHAFIGDNRTRACLHNLFDLNKCYVNRYLDSTSNINKRNAGK